MANPLSSAGPSAPAEYPDGHPRRWVILGVLIVSLLVVVLDNTILNVAMAVIASPDRGLNATQSELAWAINSYTLVFASLLFTAGVIGDRYGRRRILTAGMVLFGLSSLASAYSQSPDQLIAARALMGVGGALILPATLSIISNVFHPRERARAIGIWVSAVGLGMAIGPITGGALLERFWWGSVFLINVPIVLAGLVAILALVPESRDPAPNRIDIGGVVLSVLGLVSLVYGIIEGGETGRWGAPWVWGSIVTGVVILAGFVAYERRIAFPALDVRLFTNPRFSTAVGVVGLVFFAAMGAFFFSTFYLQMVRGYSPLAAGALLLPFAGAQLLFAPRSAAMVARYGAKKVAVVGMLLTVIALTGMATLDADTPIWLVGALFFIQGAGMANVVPPATEAVISTLPRQKAGVGSAVTNTVRQVGGALGVAVLGSLLSSVYRARIESSVADLPAGPRELASESLAGTHAVAAELGQTGDSLIAAGNTAFIEAMHWAAGSSALVAVLGALVVLRWLPGHRSAPAVPVAAPHSPEQVSVS